MCWESLYAIFSPLVSGKGHKVIMNILCIDCSLMAALQSLGHTCLLLHPSPGYIQLSQLLEDTGFKPDLIIQQETLGPRKIFTDLNEYSCFKAFWTIDTHLNAFWQVAYGKLFDLVLTPQKDWVDKLMRQGLPSVAWLPWYGFEHPWTPWQQRTHDVSFVGRVTPERMPRQYFVRFLQQKYQANCVENVDFEGLKAVYADSRIVANESIMAEVNFRPFEGAACGSMVINQRFDNGLDELFEPGKETETYEHILELETKLDFYTRHPGQARQIALAAWDRLRREHLPLHRAATLLDRCRNAPKTSVQGIDAVVAWVRTAFLFHQNTTITINLSRLRKDLESLPYISAQGLATLIQLTHCCCDWETMQSLLIPILHNNQYAHKREVNLAASMACLRADHLDMARHFLFRYLKTLPSPPSLPDLKCSEPVALCRAWSRLLRDIPFHLGFNYAPNTFLPETAHDCLLVALNYEPEHLETIKDITRLRGSQRGIESVYLSGLSYLSLRDRENWRLGTDMALTDFRVFRKKEGLEELHLAHTTAVKKGEKDAFLQRLNRMDPSGHMLACLSRQGSDSGCEEVAP